MPLEKDVTRVREGEEENDGRFRVKSALLERGIVGATTNVNRVSRGPAETAAKLRTPPRNWQTSLLYRTSPSPLARVCVYIRRFAHACVGIGATNGHMSGYARN